MGSRIRRAEGARIERISCGEKLPGLGGGTVGDFWSWAYSDAQNNTDRAVLSEFLVGEALGVASDTRVAWDDFDLLYKDKKIEVKSIRLPPEWKLGPKQ